MNSFDKELRVIFKLYNLERYYFEEATKDIKSLISKYAPKERGYLPNPKSYVDEMFNREIDSFNQYRAELFREMGIK